MIKLNVMTVTSLLLSAVQDRGFDYTYERPSEFVGCLYVHNTTKVVDDLTVDTPEEEWTPGCIVGYVLKAAGVTLGQLKAYEGNHAESVIGHLVSDGVLEIDDESTKLLREVQVKQDDHQTWGKAVIDSLGERLLVVSNGLKRSERTSQDRAKRMQQIRDLTYIY